MIKDNQIPLTPQNKGKTKTHAIWKTIVRQKEINAEIKPLLSAVKNDDVKMLIPEKIKDNEKMRIASVVKRKSSAS